MSLISKLKSLLGLESDRAPRRRDPDVTVERERTTESGSAGSRASDSRAGESRNSGSRVDDADAPSAGTSASASTESLVDDDVAAGESNSPVEAAEPAEAAGPGEADVRTDLDEVDAGGSLESDVVSESVDADEPSADETEAASSDHADETGADETEAASSEHADESAATTTWTTEGDGATGGDAVDAASVEEIKGVGPAYADRLRDAGVDTVADLSTADAADLADEIDLSPKRVGRWIDRANEHEE